MNLEFAQIPLAQLGTDDAYLLRCSAEDNRLVRAMERSLFVSPLFALRKTPSGKSGKTGGMGYTIVSGFRRFRAASKLGMSSIPVYYVSGKLLPAQRFFRMALCLNDAAGYTDADRSLMVRKTIDRFGFAWEEMIELAEFFGLPRSRKVLENYYSVGLMGETVFQAIEAGRISVQSALVLGELNASMRDLLMRDLFLRCEFTASEGQEVIEWLRDLMRREGVSLEELIRMEPLRRVLTSNGLSAREKGKGFHQALRTLRFPLFSSCESQFHKVSQKLGMGKDFVVHAPAYFEDSSLSLTLKCDSFEKFQSAVKKMVRNEYLFKDLFDLAE